MRKQNVNNFQAKSSNFTSQKKGGYAVLSISSLLIPNPPLLTAEGKTINF